MEKASSPERVATLTRRRGLAHRALHCAQRVDALESWPGFVDSARPGVPYGPFLGYGRLMSRNASSLVRYSFDPKYFRVKTCRTTSTELTCRAVALRPVFLQVCAHASNVSEVTAGTSDQFCTWISVSGIMAFRLSSP